MSFNKKGFTITEVLVAAVLLLIIGTLVIIGIAKALKGISSILGETKQQVSYSVDLDALAFDLAHAGYGIRSDESSLVASYCSGGTTLPVTTNMACAVASDVEPVDNKLLLLKETTNIIDTGCSASDPDFGFGFVLWGGSSVVYNATKCDVCGSYASQISCIWLDGNRSYIGENTCCNAPTTKPAFGYPIDTDSACQSSTLGPLVLSGYACCNDQKCTGIAWYLKAPPTPISYCLNGTYVFYRAVTNSSGDIGTKDPVLNCASDWDVWFGLDTDGDGKIDSWTNSMPPLTIQTYTNDDLKNELKAVRVYLLVQASYSPNRDYDYCSVNGHCDDAATCGDGYVTADTLVDENNNTYYVCLKHPSDPNWIHYRWNIVTLTLTHFPDIP